ncbi:MAG: AmmeMemoRadiSam system radical SAM enzyme [Desulfobulbus sp.]|jgi:pyruvate formate lyase activating enzyme
MFEAMFYRQDENNAVVCGLCPHHCRIREGGRGLCGVRENRGGRLFSLAYGRLVAEHVDPIEKKPMFHLLPGSRSYSIATVGCNLQCLHCQNAEIAHYPRLRGGDMPGHPCTPETVVERAVAAGCRSLSYTYVEPTIFIEFAHDCAVLARKRGLYNIFVTNGFMSRETAQHLAAVLDGANVDLKCFDDGLYQRLCKGRLQPVLDTIRLFHERGVLVEVTTLIIPGINDDDDMLRRTARFLCEVSPDLAWHVSAFRPAFRLQDRPPTPPETLLRARRIGLDEGLRFVYTGNAALPGGEDTCCPSCGRELIVRRGFTAQVCGMADGRCRGCGTAIAGIWS